MSTIPPLKGDELVASSLMSAARAEAGLTDFGDERFIEPLNKWLESAAADGALEPWGIAAVKSQVHGILVNRLRIQDALTKYPAILSEDLSGAVIITGFPRSGTTKLHRLMAFDPSFRTLPFWKLLNPAPFPESVGVEPDPRIDYAKVVVAMIRENFPQLLVSHPIDALLPDEESFILEWSFSSVAQVYRVRVPTYTKWWLTQDREHPYDYLTVVLKYLQWQDGGRSGRPFLLKAPLHLGNIDILAERFPGCTIIHCHRDPVASVPSIARLIGAFRSLTGSPLDVAETRRLALDYWAAEMDRHMKQRDALSATVRFVDVGFSEIVGDASATLQRIYEQIGRAVPKDIAERLSSGQDGTGDHRTHSYSLEQFELSEAEIRHAYGAYIDRFLSIGSA